MLKQNGEFKRWKTYYGRTRTHVWQFLLTVTRLWRIDYSPAQILMRQQLCSSVPAHTEARKPRSWCITPDSEIVYPVAACQIVTFHHRQHALELPPLRTEPRIWVKDAKQNVVVAGTDVLPCRTDGKHVHPPQPRFFGWHESRGVIVTAEVWFACSRLHVEKAPLFVNLLQNVLCKLA